MLGARIARSMSEDRDPAEGVEPSDSFNAADPSQVAARKRKASVREDQQKDFLGRALADPAGRQFFWLLLSSLHVFDERYGVAGSANCPEATQFFAGEREAALRILRMMIKSQPAMTAQMLAEHDHG